MFFLHKTISTILKYTKTTLKKIEAIFEEIAYVVRYEKGNFQSGYCMVENRKIAVINKFYDTEGRINCLLEIMGIVNIDPSNLTEKSAKFFKVLQNEKEIANKEKEALEEATTTEETDK